LRTENFYLPKSARNFNVTPATGQGAGLLRNSKTYDKKTAARRGAGRVGQRPEKIVPQSLVGLGPGIPGFFL
jgi:hypothetical protein